jgi:hypothetical protein
LTHLLKEGQIGVAGVCNGVSLAQSTDVVGDPNLRLNLMTDGIDLVIAMTGRSRFSDGHPEDVKLTTYYDIRDSGVKLRILGSCCRHRICTKLSAR